MKDFSIIVAMDQNRGIGKNGGLPWHLPADMKHFKAVTLSAASGKQNAVVMGRKTWESIPSKFRPLPGRLNVILTRSEGIRVPDGCLQFSDLKDALMDLSRRLDIDHIFIIGGASIYAQALSFSACRFLYITEIHHVFDCDAFFPEIPAGFARPPERDLLHENSLSFAFLRYERCA